MTPGGWGWFVVLFPLLGCLVISFGWRSLPERTAGWLASGAVFASFVSAVGAFIGLHDHPPEERTFVSNCFDYLHTAGVNVDMAIQVDPL